MNAPFGPTGESSLPADFPGFIRGLRTRQRLSQVELSRLLGVSKLSILRWEHGRTRPSALAWERLLRVEQQRNDAGDPQAGCRPLPLLLTSFIGREPELAALGALLPQTRLLTLAGSGGCGKTRLALELARRAQLDYADGVALVELGPLSNPAFVPQAAADALGVREVAGVSLAATLAEFLDRRRLLLLLDNCEHLLNSCATLVEQLLKVCPRLTVLATSREPLGVAGEAIRRVPPLGLAEEGWGLERAATTDSVRLFRDRALLVDPDFAITDANLAAVAQISRQLDGIPLVLELAAAQLSTLSVEQVAGRLTDRFRLLTGGSRTAPPRQRTLAAAIDWSYDLLPPEEQYLLRHCSVFAGDCSLAALTAVVRSSEAGEVSEASPHGLRRIDEPQALMGVRRLVETSMLIAETRAGERRFRLLETLRAYAFERLQEAGEAEAAQRRHAGHFLQLAAEAERGLVGAEQREWLERLDLEHDNLRAALCFLHERGEDEALLQLTACIWRFWDIRGHVREGRQWLEAALAAGAGTPGWRAAALNGAGILAARDGEYDAATRFWECGLALRDELGEQPVTAHLLLNLGNAVMHQGDFAGASRLMEESLATFRRLGDTPSLAFQTADLGFLACLQGDYARAHEVFTESLALCRETGNAWGAALALSGLAWIAITGNDPEEARRLSEECLDTFRALNCTLLVIEMHNRLGHLARRARDFRAAAAHHCRALREIPAGGNRKSLGGALYGLAILAAERRQTDRAALLLGAAEARRETVATLPPVFEADAARTRSRVCALLGEQRFAALQDEGQRMTPEQAAAYAIAMPEATEMDTNSVAAPAAPVPSRSDAPSILGVLTRRQYEVLRLLAAGQSNRAIAAELVVSLRTVEHHITTIYNNLGARNRAEATAYFLGRREA